MVRSIKSEDWAKWLRLRLALWPHCARERHESEMSAILRDHKGAAAIVSTRDEGKLCGFVEVTIRSFAEGCKSRPVGYIEGWYGDPDCRRKGMGRALVAAAEQWARSQGCSEMGSDADLSNVDGQEAHRRLGYMEFSRNVHFRKDL